MNETIVDRCHDMATRMVNDGLSKEYIIAVLYSKFSDELGITNIDYILTDVINSA